MKRRGYASRFARTQFEPELKWAEQVFVEIEPTFPFNRVLKIEIPLPRLLDRARVMPEPKPRQPWIRLNRHPAPALLQRSIERRVRVSQLVISAKRDQWAHFEP